MDKPIQCISCKKYRDALFKNALPVHYLNKATHPFLVEIAKMFNVSKFWQPPFKVICAPCLRNLQQSDSNLASLLKGTQLEKDIAAEIRQFGADRLSSLF
ncbi:TPA: hypothetical protein ACQUHH_003057 [Bacillus mobilis]